MAVGIRESTVVEPAHIHDLSDIGRAAGGGRSLDDGVYAVAAVAGQSEQDLAGRVRVGDRLGDEGREVLPRE